MLRNCGLSTYNSTHSQKKYDICDVTQIQLRRFLSDNLACTLMKTSCVARGEFNIVPCHKRAKTPILLPTHHHVVELIIADSHERTIHSELNSTVAKTRQRNWIVRGRQAVKKVVRRCMICKKLEGQPYPLPRAPDLPEQRVSDDPPFTYTGVDFAGPIYTTPS